MVEPEHWLFIDEFFHSLLQNPVTYTTTGDLGGILAVPRLGKKRVFVSGMHVGQLTDVLN